MKQILVIFLSIVGLVSIAKNDDGVKKAKGWKKYELTVRLTTGQTLELKTRFNTDYCNKVMFLYDENDNPIYPQNTISVERKLKDGTVITGYPTDSLWLFQAFKGEITGFSTRPENKLKHVEYLLKKGGNMVEFETETLRSMLSDNQEALGLFYKSETKKKMSKNIYAASFLVGLAHVYAPSPIKKTVNPGATNEYKKDIMFYPFVALGGIIGAAHCNNRSKKILLEAINTYNK